MVPQSLQGLKKITQSLPSKKPAFVGETNGFREIGMINTRRLFICSCIALVTSAFTFSLHGDVMQEIGQAFNFTQEQNGAIGLAIFWGMAASMLVGGFVCDFLGLKNVMFLALACHLTGSLGIVFSRQILGEGKAAESYYHWL